MNLFTTLLSRAIAASDACGVELDHTLFRALLFALLARRKHLIVRAPEEDIPRILKGVIHVLHTVLALSVLKLKLRSSDIDTLSPDDFLRLLFLRVSQNPDFGSYNIHPSSRPGSRKASALNESLTGTLPFKRSSSYPNTKYSLDEFHAHSRFLSDNPNLARSQTDPLHPQFPSNHGADVPSNELPQALVLTGLEHASNSVQEALWRVMSDNKFSLNQSNTNSTAQSDRNRTGSIFEEGAEYHQDAKIWNLNENFLIVYVCPVQDGRERPPIHKSLIRVMHRCRHFISDILPKATSVRKIIFGRTIAFTGRWTILSPTDLTQIQRILFPPSPLSRLCKTPLTNPNLASRPSLLLADLLSALRHHPHLEGSLLSARCHAHCVDLIRAHGVLFGELSVGQEPSPDCVTDEDVRRVVLLSAVVHRLRVRGGPDEEVLASAVYPAVRDDGNAHDGRVQWTEGRRTVREVLKVVVESF